MVRYIGIYSKLPSLNCSNCGVNPLRIEVTFCYYCDSWKSRVLEWDVFYGGISVMEVRSAGSSPRWYQVLEGKSGACRVYQQSRRIIYYPPACLQGIQTSVSSQLQTIHDCSIGHWYIEIEFVSNGSSEAGTTWIHWFAKGCSPTLPKYHQWIPSGFQIGDGHGRIEGGGNSCLCVE